MIVVDPVGHLAVCGRADFKDAMVDGKLRQTWKLICYAGELIVSGPLDTVWRHLPF